MTLTPLLKWKEERSCKLMPVVLGALLLCLSPGIVDGLLMTRQGVPPLFVPPYFLATRRLLCSHVKQQRTVVRCRSKWKMRQSGMIEALRPSISVECPIQSFKSIPTLPSNMSAFVAQICQLKALDTISKVKDLRHIWWYSPLFILRLKKLVKITNNHPWSYREVLVIGFKGTHNWACLSAWDSP